MNRPNPSLLLPLVGVSLCTLAVLAPGLFSSEAIGHPISDMPDHLQGSWWFGGEILSGRVPLYTRITHLPGGGVLWYADPVGALLALPFRSLGYPAAWNLTLLIQVWLTGLAGLWLGWQQTRRPEAAFFCGLVGVASPYGISLLHSGVSEALGLAWPTFFLAALLRMHAGGGFGLPALLLGLCTVQSAYYGLFGGLLVAVFIPGEGWRARLGASCKLGAVWAALAVPLLAAIRWTLAHPDAVFSAAQTPGWNQPAIPATDLLSWFHPGAWYAPDTPALGNPGILHVNYLGFVLVALAIFGAIRARPQGLTKATLGYGVLCLGPVLSFNRKPVYLGSQRLFLPLALLFIPGSPFASVHHPYRMVAFLLPLLGLLAAEGLPHLPRLVRWGAPIALLAEWLLVSPAPWPVATTPVTPTAVLEKLEGDGAILDWPPDRTTANRAYLLAQVHHGRPIPYGPARFLSETLRADPLVAELLENLEDPVGRARGRDVPFMGTVLLAPVGKATRLRSHGFDTVLLHRRYLSENELALATATLTEWLGEVDADVEGVLGWRLDYRDPE